MSHIVQFEHYCIRCAISIADENAQTHFCPECTVPMSKVFEQDLHWDNDP